METKSEVCRKPGGCFIQRARIFSGLPCSGLSNSYSATGCYSTPGALAHSCSPARLSSFESHFVNYFAFGCSAMSDCIESGMLIGVGGRPYGGVICLVAKRLRTFTTTIHCEERFTVVKIFNCPFFNVYLPCV